MRTTLLRCGDGWSEDTRINCFKQVTLWIGLILCLLSLGRPVGHAESSGAATHLAVARQSAPAAGEEAQRRALELSQAAVEAGDLAGARQLLEEAFGPEALRLPNARGPVVGQSLLRVRSRTGNRVISMQLVDAAAPGAATKLVREVASAVQHVAPVLAAGNSLTVTLAYADPAEVLIAQHRLAAALPEQPELALLSSVLTSRRLAWPEEAGLVTRTSRYEERVDLSQSATRWISAAQKLETAAEEAERSGDPLDAVRAAVWRADARAWRDMAALSRVTFEVALREQGAGPEWLQTRVHDFYREGSIEREWMVRAGETRQLETAIIGWRYDRLVLAAGAFLSLTVIGVALLWFVSR